MNADYSKLYEGIQIDSYVKIQKRCKSRTQLHITEPLLLSNAMP